MCENTVTNSGKQDISARQISHYVYIQLLISTKIQISSIYQPNALLLVSASTADGSRDCKSFCMELQSPCNLRTGYKEGDVNVSRIKHNRQAAMLVTF